MKNLNFTMDNTEGYTQSQLNTMNKMVAERLTDYTCPDDNMYKYICEQVQIEFNCPITDWE